jgi:hypothetical protein
VAITNHMYGLLPGNAFAGSVGWPTTGGTVRGILLKSSYTPDQDAHRTKADLTVASNELAAGGDYVAGGGTVTNPSRAYTAAGNIWTLDGDDLIWTNISGTFRYCALVDGTASTGLLYGYVDFGADQIVSGVGFQVNWNASGIFQGTVAP